MTQDNVFYLFSGFVLGFLVMLLFHVRDREKRKKAEEQKRQEAVPKIHVPKYAAGSDIDSIRYHYEETTEPEVIITDAGKVFLLILLLAFIVFMIGYCFEYYFS